MSAGAVRAPSALGTGTATENIVASLDWLSWNQRRVVLLRRGADDLWTSLSARLREIRGVSVVDVELSGDDRNMYYDPSGPVASEHDLSAGDLLIHQDPLIANAGESPCDDFRSLAARGVAVVSIEFPCGRHADPRLRSAYLRALTTKPVDIAARATAVRTALADATSLWIEDGAAVLAIGGGPVFDDRTAPQSSNQLLQLPLGEVWLLPDRSTTAGRILLRPGDDELEVTAGRVRPEPWPHGDLIELGVGVNPAASPLPSALGEKTLGRLHLGFGDSVLLGGEVAGPRHADIYLAPTARLYWRDSTQTVRTLSDVLC